jgi:hypothetical protein
MSLTFDEYGRPYIILREQEAKRRVRGIDALKVLIGSLSKISLPPRPSPIRSSPHWVRRASTRCSCRPTSKSPLPTTEPPFSKRWRSNIPSPNCSSSSPRVRTTRSETEPPALWCSPAPCLSRPSSSLTRVQPSF